MRQNFRKFLFAMTCALVSHSAVATDLKVSALQSGVAELDLFSTAASGSYIKSVDAGTLQFPIDILEDRNGGFVIKLGGEKYYVGAADVVTNKKYDVTAGCDNEFATNLVAATRGIAGKGC